jgi:ribosomal protein L40E
MECISCGLRNVEDARFCGHCGINIWQRAQTLIGQDDSAELDDQKGHDGLKKLVAQIMFCFSCGLRSCDDARFCGQCGVNLKLGLPLTDKTI